MPRRIVEERLVEAIKRELFSEEAVELFISETMRLLKEKQGEQAPDLATAKRNLARTEKEITNIMSAIKRGIVTTATKAELERAEAERTRLETTLKTEGAAVGKLIAFLPRAAEHYTEMVAGLRANLQRDVTKARQNLKALVGSVTLSPMPEGYLEAQLQHSPEGLALLAGDAGLKLDWLRGQDLNL